MATNNFVRTALTKAEVCRKTTPVMVAGEETNKIVDVARADTAIVSVGRFLKAVDTFSDPSLRHRLSGITIGAVGMKMGRERRGGRYDLWWFPNEPDAVYAVDDRDSNVVYRSGPVVST